jgi:hypothetical protein
MPDWPAIRAGSRESAEDVSAIFEARPLLQTSEPGGAPVCLGIPGISVALTIGPPDRHTGRCASSGSGRDGLRLGRTIGHTGAAAWQRNCCCTVAEPLPEPPKGRRWGGNDDLAGCDLPSDGGVYSHDPSTSRGS